MVKLKKIESHYFGEEWVMERTGSTVRQIGKPRLVLKQDT